LEIGPRGRALVLLAAGPNAGIEVELAF
jgi:hypothetical protein